MKQIETARNADSIKVLIFEGTQSAFARGGREHYNEAIAQDLYQSVASFPYPVIAAMQGDAAGAGFLLGALCDFMVCSETASYRYTHPDAGLFPSAEEDRLFSKRFGQVRAANFLYGATTSTGKQLREKQWSCPVLPGDQVEAYARTLASNLAKKSQTSLRLLKQHLARHMLDLAKALAPVESSPSELPGGAKISAPGKHIQLETHADKVLVLRVRNTKKKYETKTLVADLTGLFAQLRNHSAYRAIVLASDYPDFLPAADAKVPVETALAMQRALLQAPLPVIAVMNPSATGKAWFVSQFCDAAVYQRDGRYSAASLLQSPELAGLAASIFAHRFGNEAARTILLTGAAYTGAELQQYAGPISAAPQDQALSEALKLAASWAEWPASAVLAWKKRTALGIQEEIDRVPAGLASKGVPEGKRIEVSTPIALASKAVSATVHPEGIVEVTMQDRESKNMFSDAFIQGMNEVFAHIDATPDYKVVILTGYDKYFATGGTKAALEAIHQGKLKFTEDQTFRSALDCKIPVIAAIQGHAIGAGLSLGLFSDLPLLSEESKYVSPYMSYGFTPGVGATLIVPERMGQDLARDSLMTAQEYDGTELKDRGVPLPVHARKHLPDAAMQLAKTIARNSRSSLILIKSHLNRHIRDGLEDVCEREVAMHELTFVGQSDTLNQIHTAFSQKESMPKADPVVENTVSTPAVAQQEASAASAAPALEAVTLPDVVDAIKRLLAQELHLEEDEVDENMQYTDLGLDSITGVTWIRKINQMFGLSLDATIVYSYPTLKKLGRHVKEEVESRDTRSSVPDFAEREASKHGYREAEGKAVATVSLDLIDLPPAREAVALPDAAATVSLDLIEAPVSAPAPAPAREALVLPEVVASLKLLLARELHLEEDELDENTQYTDLGLDSITGVTWIRKVNEKYGLSLDATIVYSYPTLTKLGRHVKEEVENRDTHSSVPDFAEREASKHGYREAEGKTVATVSLDLIDSPPAREAVALPEAAATVSLDLIEAPVSAPAQAREALVLQDVVTSLKLLLARELHLEEYELDENTQYTDLGLDSITGVTWIRKVNEKYGLSLDATIVYSYPTLTKLGRHVKEQVENRDTHSSVPDFAEREASKHGYREVEGKAVVAVSLDLIDSPAPAPVSAPAQTAVMLPEVVASLKRLLARELHLEEDELDENTQYTDLGLDSITGVTWIRRVNEKYGLSLDATIVYSYPTLTKLGRHVKEQVENRDTRSSVPDFAEREASKHGYREAEGKTVATVSLDLIGSPAPVQTLTASPAPAQTAVVLPEVVASLKRLLARELHLEEDELDENTQYTDLGLDSITGVTWIRKVNEKYVLSLDATIVYSYPTLAKLGQHVKEQVENRDTRSSVPDFAEREASKHGYREAESKTVVAVSLDLIGSPAPAPAQTAVMISDVVVSLKRLLARELHLEEHEVDENAQYTDLGLDSITGVTWIRKVNEKYGLSLDATIVYSYPTLAKLGRHVKEQVENRDTRSSVPDFAEREASKHGYRSAEDKTVVAVSLDLIDSPAPAPAPAPAAVKLPEVVASPKAQPNEPPKTLSASKPVSEPSGDLANEPAPVRELASWRKQKPASVGRSAEAPVSVKAEAPVSTSTEAPSRSAEAPSAHGYSLEPIAVIGMAGQFPKANNLEEYWQNLAEGKDCISEVPASRWDINAYFQAGEPAEGKTNSKYLGSLEECDLFDPLFFNISPAEARAMDPQQRVFLQACWHSIEHAGYNPKSLAGSRCGVFVGVGGNDYALLSRKVQLSAHGFVGNAMSILSARISYFLDLQGPCLAIDTACSSSLVAIAAACDSLISGASDLALAGGVYVGAGPAMHIMCSQSGMLSPDGKCYTFDHRANGFAPGEGVGAVVLKRLADAERDGDIIHAVVQGWGVNQDGKTNGITAPNPESQARLMEEIYRRHKIDPAEIQLIEAHGTGTPLGDPIEINGLKKSFRAFTQAKDYCAIGSVKSNIGHCLTAAGVSAFIKVVLALTHKQLPPTINYERLNEHINLKGSPFYVNDRLQNWALKGASRRQAAVSSFGYSGTNAHMVVAEYVPPRRVKPEASPANSIIPLSAKTGEQLKQRARDLLDFIRREGHSTDLAEMAYTLQVGREAMDERVGFMVGSIAQLAEKLQAYVAGEQSIPDTFHGQVRLNKEGLSLISQDEELKETILDNWIAQKKYSKLLRLWSKGLELDWNKLYGEAKPQRIVLPTYPFAKERYWIDNLDGMRADGTAVLHPLVHRNTSTLSRQSYTSILSEPLSQDNLMEMARVAAALASPERQEFSVELRDVAWGAPFVAAENTEVTVELFAADADCVGFEITSRGAVHCTGQASFVNRPAAVIESSQQLHFQEYWQEQPFAAAQTNSANARKTVIFADAESGKLLSGAVVVDQPADIEGVIRRVNAESKLPVSVIYTWAKGKKEAGIHSVFDLFKAVKACGNLVSDVVLVGHYDPAHQDSTWDYSWIGFERSLKLVLPEVKVSVLYTNASACTAAQLLDAQQSRGVIWYRDGKRLVLSFKSVEARRAPQTPAIKQNGAYLITGGCGALGMNFARHLAQNYHAKLVLLGRSALSPSIQEQLDSLRKAGAVEVHYASVDIGNSDDLKAWAQALSLPISGVFHAAGTEDARPFFEKSAADIDKVLRPKTTGTVLLDEVLQNHPLDFVCYFSSSAGVLGDFGSCDYSVANRYQMAYGQYRQHHRQFAGKTVVINWPFWQKEAGQKGGMGSDDPDRVAFYLKSSGQDALGSAEGLRIWQDLMHADQVQTLVMIGQPTRVEQFLNRIYLAERPAQTAPVQAAPVQAAPVPAAPVPAPRASQPQVKGSSLNESLRLELRRLVSADLQIDAGRLDDRTNLADYGFDSISLASFAKKLTSHFSVEVTPALFFNYSTIQQLVDYFATEHQEHFQNYYGKSVDADGSAQAAAAIPSPAPAPIIPAQALSRGRFISSAASGAPQQARRTSDLQEPIAIVGMSGRFPQADNVEEFWNMLAEGRSGVTEVPLSRWDWRDYFTAPGHIGNVISTNRGGFIDGVDEFDPLFFEVAPVEAEEMDPSERILLMEAYRAIEDARISPASLRGKDVGVFVGMEESQYSLVTEVPGVTTIGAAMISSRLSYFLDLHGPTIATNTACSSGLVALHQAAMSLRQGECESALVAGVALSLSPKAWIKMSEARMISQDGECFSFSKKANGIGVGEAVVVLMLKPLSAAIANGDHVYATIKASGINFDGKTNGVTAPNGRMQAKLIEKVYTDHNVDIRDVSHIVTHGTGTKLGDPVEIDALNSAFKGLSRQQGIGAPAKPHCAITSAKTNVGHTMGASGLVSLVGLLKGIEHRQIPATLYCEEENDYISWRDSHFYINKSTREWQTDGDKLRIGAVSAFGRSGTNAHVVVEEYRPAAKRPTATTPAGTAVIIPLSARATQQLQQKARDLLDFIRRPAQADLASMAYTLQVAREPMEERLAFVVSSVEQLAQELSAYISGKLNSENAFHGTVNHKNDGVRLLSQDSDMQETIEKWIAGSKLPKLAELWTKGLDLDWEKLYGEAQSRPERIGLPTYPFAKERYWIEGPVSNEYSEKDSGTDDRLLNSLESIEEIINKIDEGSMEKDQAAAFLKKMAM